LIIIGIDPGVAGAIAAIQHKEVLEVHDLPLLTTFKTTKTKSGKQKKNNQLDIEEFFIMYKDMVRAWRPELVIIEKVTSMPGDGAVSAFAFGQTFGRIESIIRTTGGSRIHYTTPPVWKKHHKLLKKGKQAAVELCRLHYPDMISIFLKTKDGRADAVLIAEYGRYLCLSHLD